MSKEVGAGGRFDIFLDSDCGSANLEKGPSNFAPHDSSRTILPHRPGYGLVDWP